MPANPVLRNATTLCLALVLGTVAAGVARAAGPDPGAAEIGVAHCSGVQDHDLVRPEDTGTPAARALWIGPRDLFWSGMADPAAGPVVLMADGRVVANARPVRQPPAHGTATRHMGDGVWLTLGPQPTARLRAWAKADLRLAQLDASGQPRAQTRIQTAPLLDRLFAKHALRVPLGAQVENRARTRFGLWAPTAHAVGVCLEGPGPGGGTAFHRLAEDASSGVWSAVLPQDLHGWRYRYLLLVHVPGIGLVRQRVTDPYAASLTADSARAAVVDMGRADVRPEGWAGHRRPGALQRATDLSAYELHVRDFSWNDPTVPANVRGKYLAFTSGDSAGMRHLRELARAGLTDVHLMPVFDFSTVPERACIAQPPGAAVVAGQSPSAIAPDNSAAAEAVARAAAGDCYNWGYDPWHFNAPEGSYASDPDDPASRVRELRAAVAALHGIGLRVGMDVVFNHTSASGQARASVLDRIVPGYYHRRNAQGAIERSTCCENTATEHVMMERLMSDSMAWWARHYAIDSFRLDLMGHIPKEAVLRARRAAERAAGRRIDVIGEGWDFGEVSGGARFVQAAQLPMTGSGVATFNDRLRDAVRGPRPDGTWQALEAGVGWLQSAQRGIPAQAQAALADQVRAGLAGSVGSFVLRLHDGSSRRLADMRYGDAPWGYAREPGDVVNYVENHDDLGLFDLNALRLPPSTSPQARAQLQLVALATGLLAQGRAYVHAGVELMRSKSLDRNSYDSGDWFNRIDWQGEHNGFGIGLPPAADNEAWWPLMRQRLSDAARIRPGAADIDLVRRGMQDLLRIRASSPLFRLDTAGELDRQLRLPLASPQPNPAVVALWLRPAGQGEEVLALFSVSDDMQQVRLPELGDGRWRLHPVLASAGAGDPRIAREARAGEDGRSFEVPPRSVAVWLRDSR